MGSSDDEALAPAPVRHFDHVKSAGQPAHVEGGLRSGGVVRANDAALSVADEGGPFAVGSGVGQRDLTAGGGVGVEAHRGGDLFTDVAGVVVLTALSGIGGTDPGGEGARYRGEGHIVGVRVGDVGHMTGSLDGDEAVGEPDFLGSLVEGGTAVNLGDIEAEQGDRAGAVGDGAVGGAVDRDERGIAGLHPTGVLEGTRDVEDAGHIRAVARVAGRAFEAAAHAGLGRVDDGGDFGIVVDVSVVDGQKSAGRNTAHVNAVGIDAPGIAFFLHRFAEVTDGGAAVVHPSPNGANQLVFEVEQVGDAQTVGDAGHRVAHAGEILAHGHHIGAVIGTSEEESAVGDDEQGSVRLAVAHRFVEVEVQLRVAAKGVDIAPIHMALRYGDVVKHRSVPVALSVTFSLALQCKEAGCQRGEQEESAHLI